MTVRVSLWIDDLLVDLLTLRDDMERVESRFSTAWPVTKVIVAREKVEEE